MVRTIQHPLIANELTRLRDPQCAPPEFRQRLRRIGSLLAPYVTEDLSVHTVECRTPLEITSGSRLSRGITLVPIPPAGSSFMDGFLDMMPDASVFHAERDDRGESKEREILILDPTLATGSSAIQTIQKMHHCGATRIRFACLIAAPEGIATLHDAYPGIPVYTAAIDRGLNDRGRILPGLGDTSDRLFGGCP